MRTIAMRARSPGIPEESHNMQPRQSSPSPNDDSVDVLIIGGGINGAAAGQHLAAAGYSVHLVDKGDFASAATGRSTRILHFGLRYLAPDKSPWEFVLHPVKFLRKFRESLVLAGEYERFRRDTPEYLNPYPVFVPIYRGGGISGWQIDIAAHLLGATRSTSSSKYKRHARASARALPAAQLVRDNADIDHMMEFEDCQFAWPERICLDALMDIERRGGRVRNYTRLSALSFEDGLWSAVLDDGSGRKSTIAAKVVVNTAGAWVDEIIQLASKSRNDLSPKVAAVKGIHIMAKLPDQFSGKIIVGRNRANTQLSCIPWRGLHYIGPTEFPYDGSLENVVPLEEDVEFLVGEANHFFPTLSLKREDVRFAWAGVRPKTYHPKHPIGDPAGTARIHALAGEGLPNFFALTWGTLNQHRLTARRLVKSVSRVIRPSRASQPLSYTAAVNRRALEAGNRRFKGEPLDLKLLADLAAAERPRTLVDLLFRRTDLGWGPFLSYDDLLDIGAAVAPVLDWSDTKLAEEIDDYVSHVRQKHLFDMRSALPVRKTA